MTYLAYLIPGVFLLGAAIVAGIFTIINRRGSSRTPLPPSWPEMWSRLDDQDKKIAALVSVLETVADEWPANTKGPVFDPKDLLILQDAVPRRWRTN